MYTISNLEIGINELNFDFILQFEKEITFDNWETKLVNPKINVTGYYCECDSDFSMYLSPQKKGVENTKNNQENTLSIDLYDFCEMNDLDYEVNRQGFIATLPTEIFPTETEHKLKALELKHKALKLAISRLFKKMDDCTWSLWSDDLECTHECVILEHVDGGVKMDDETEIRGDLIVKLMESITNNYLK